MNTDRTFPFSVAVLGSVRLGANKYEEDVALTRLVDDCYRADRNRTPWLERQQALARLRFGIRKKKDFPWPNSSNLGLPLIDSQIRRMKPLFIKLIVQPDPIVEFVGEDADAVDAERKAEAEFNWLFKTHMNAIEPMTYIVDSVLSRGIGIAQVGWEYQTEYECRVCDLNALFQGQIPQDGAAIAQRLVDEYGLDPNDPRVTKSIAAAVSKALSGSPFVKLAFKRVICDRPAIYDREPVQIIVPPRTTDYGNAEWICVQHLFSIRKLEQLEADGVFDRGFVESVRSFLGRTKDSSTIPGDPSSVSTSMAADRSFHDTQERIWGTEDEGNVLLWEIYHWHDIDGDGLKDRVVTFIHPASRTKASSRPFAYPFHRWPFVKFDFEKTSRRFHAPRGIAGMLEALNRELNAQHNARIDAMTLHNAPVYQMPVLAGFKAKNYRATPGTMIEVPLGAEIRPISHDRGGFGESISEEQLLRQTAEGYIGSFDNTLTSAAGDNRTATEVNAAVQLAASTASLDTILFQLQMRELYMLVWELWLDNRPLEVSYKVLGTRQDSNDPELVTVKKSEINKRFKLIPTGTIANTNHALELSNSREAMQFFLNDQSGFINPYELRRWYLGLLDYRITRRVLNPQNQAQELVTLRSAAAALQQDPSLAAAAGGGPPPAGPENTDIAGLPLSE